MSWYGELARLSTALRAAEYREDELPAPCVATVDLIEHGPCECPWEDHTTPVDTLPPF